jgi:hypothetical protein
VTDHSQVPIRHGHLAAEVDQGIAPLILALWKAGVATTSSCQASLAPEDRGVGAYAYIGFHRASDAEKFLELMLDPIVDLATDALYEHLTMEPWNVDDIDDEEIIGWKSQHAGERWDWYVRPERGPSVGVLSVAVYLPVEDLAEVTRRAALARRR